MSKKTLLLGMAALAIVCNCFAGGLPKPVLIYPSGREAFRPGRTVEIQWDIRNADAARFCEQEIFLIVNKVSYRITPEMGPLDRSYKWVVPNIPGVGVLELHLGCDTLDVFETKNADRAHAFRIRRE